MQYIKDLLFSLLMQMKLKCCIASGQNISQVDMHVSYDLLQYACCMAMVQLFP